MKIYKPILFILCLLPFFMFGQTNVEQYQKFEITVDLSPMNQMTQSQRDAIALMNPFQKNEIELRVVIHNPDNSIKNINGFYYEKILITDDPNLGDANWPNLPAQFTSNTNDFSWKFRFTPEEVGVYNYTMSFYIPSTGTSINAGSGTFNCTATSLNKAGFVLLNHDRFEYSDGGSFIPIGINTYRYPDWVHNDGAPKINYFELYFKRLSENGCNTARITIDHVGAMSLVGGSLDDDIDANENCTYYLREYDLKDAYVMDKIIESAENNNIKIHLRMFANTGFNYWSNNSYNENMAMTWCGDLPSPGMLDLPEEFFSMDAQDPVAIDVNNLQTSYLKYIIDRWGYSTAISVWEIFAEGDILGGNPPDIADWHIKQIDLVKDYDIYKRPVTTSWAGMVYDFGPSFPFYELVTNAVDFIELHRYSWQFKTSDGGQTFNNQYDYRKVMFEEMQEFDVLYDKPIMVTEGGNFLGGKIGKYVYKYEDLVAYGYHHSLWSNVTQGVCAPYFDWEWDAFIDQTDSNHPATNYFNQINAVSNFLSNFDAIGTNNHVETQLLNPETDSLCVNYSLNTQTKEIFGWVQDYNFNMQEFIELPDPGQDLEDETNYSVDDYLEGLDPNLKPERASSTNSFEINLPETGSYKLDWYDTETGDLILSEAINATQSIAVNLNIPGEMLNSPYGDAAFIIRKSNEGLTGDYTSSNNQVLANTKIQFNNEKLFYVKDDGTINAIYETQNDNWTSSLINPNGAPKMVSGSNISIGFDVTSGANCSNEIFYATSGKDIYKMYYSNGAWISELTTLSTNVRRDSELHIGSMDRVFYVDDSSDKIYVLYKSGNNWYTGSVNNTSEQVMPGSGFVVIQDPTNHVLYVGANDNKIYELFWQTGLGWVSQLASNAALVRSNSKLIEGDGNKLFYVGTNHKIYSLYQDGGNWMAGLLNENAPLAETGVGFDLYFDGSNNLYYTDVNNNIIKMYWSPEEGWVFETTYIASSSSGGAKKHHNVAYSENNMFYVGVNDSKVHRLQKVYQVPFTVKSTTICKLDNWDLEFTDNEDVGYRFIVDVHSTIFARTSNPGTTIQQSKIQIYNSNGTSMSGSNGTSMPGWYKYIGSPNSGNELEVELYPGEYYIAVDGYDVGDFELTVNRTIIKGRGREEELEFPILKENQNLFIYPNPANNFIKVQLPNAEKYTLHIYGIEGELVKSMSSVGGLIELNCNDFNNGLYVIIAQSNSNFLKGKFVIAR